MCVSPAFANSCLPQLTEAVSAEHDGDVSSVSLLKYQTKVVAGVMYKLHVAANGATEATHYITAYRAPGAGVEIQKTEKA